MFEKLVESLLEEYVSDWIEGLDAEKMKIGLFGGKVEFRELKLKTSSLDKFQLPIKIKEGTLGRLSMKVPWKRLTKEAVKIQVDDLFLLVVPTHQEDMQRQQQQRLISREDDSVDSYALRLRWAKQQEVRVRELFERNKTEELSGNRPSDAGSSSSTANDSGDTTASWGYREKILHNIIDNVSFEITKIHIRYEDTTQLISKNPLAIGVTIDSITASTTNANGHVAFVDRAQSHTPFVHRIVEMVLAGFYCDDTSSVQDLIQLRRHAPKAGSYIIHPFNTSVKMTANHDETTAFSIPRFQFVADISSIGASVTPDQCTDLINVINFVSTHEIYLKHLHCRRKRPTVAIKKNAKAWWQYAFYGVQVMYSLHTRKLPLVTTSTTTGANGQKATKRGRRCTWKLFATLWLKRKEYISLQKKVLKAAVKKAPIETFVAEKCRLNELEDELDVETIVFFRLCAMHEFELEESRQDAVKKISNWKVRWSSKSSHGTDNDANVLKQLDPLERLVVYSTVSEQMHASSIALQAKELEKQNSKAILFALDIAVSSFTVSLVEHFSGMVSATSTREFLRFDLQKFMFAIFQRTSACTITSSIKSIEMLDFSNAYNTADGRLQPQALFYALTADSPLYSSNDAVVATAQQNFVELSIASSETKFKLDCAFQPFRFVHNLAVAAKLQTFLTSPVEASPALKENAEEAFVSSSMWLNNAVFASAAAPSPLKADVRNQPSIAALAVCVVEFSVRLPHVDVFVLSSEVSPILHAKLADIHFKSGNRTDTFAFAIESVEILFLDGLPAGSSTSTSANGSRDASRHRSAAIVAEEEANAGQTIAPCTSYTALEKRKQSTILRKTRLVFQGEKITERGRVPRWHMKCTAPPIYFTLSTAQYQQVLSASASWANSNRKPPVLRNRSPAAASSTALVASAVIKNTKEHEKKESCSEQRADLTPSGEFDPDDERFSLCVHIPRIMVVLQGQGGINETPNDETDAAAGNKQETKSNTSDDELAIDLVLDIKRVNVEVKASSAAQAIALELRSLELYKRRHSDEKRSKESLIEEEAADEDEETTTSSSSLPEPDPAFDPQTGRACCKLLEIGDKVTFMISSISPFKGKLKARQVAIYWDHNLLIALFRSYLIGNGHSFGTGSNASSAASSRTGSGTSSNGGGDDAPAPLPISLAAVAAAVEPAPPAPFRFEFVVDKYFIFLRPCGTKSSQFSFRLYGKNLYGNVSTLATAYVVTEIQPRGGLVLESCRFVPSSDGANGTTNSGGEEVCELLQVHGSTKLLIETAGYGSLRHRTGAGAYLDIQASKIEVNYVNGHYAVLVDHVQRHLIGFFNWITVQMKPSYVAVLNERTKIDAKFTDITLWLPRGAVGNATELQRKPERVELEVDCVTLSSRVFPSDPRFEQILIEVEHVHVSTCMVDEQHREHTDAIASVDEAVTVAKVHQANVLRKHDLRAEKTTVFKHEHVYIEVVSMPPPVIEKAKKPAAKTSTERKDPSSKRTAIDLEDVAKEMEKICSFVTVSLTPLPSIIESKQPSKRKSAMAIDVGKVLEISMDQRQLELMACVLSENLGQVELLPRPISPRALLDEKRQVDVQILIGNACLEMLEMDAPGQLTDVSTRVMGKLDLENVQVQIHEYSSGRGQYRVTSSKASIVQVDVTTADDENDDDEEGAMEQVETMCADLFLSSEGDTCQCIDVTIDKHAPASNPPVSMDVRVHLDTVAISPPLIIFALRAAPFVLCAPRFPHYVPQPSQPVSVSVTTGTVFIMLANHTPPQQPIDLPEDDPSSDHDESELKLVLAGCIVVRYSNADEQLKHVQVFGRKMSLEICSQWPPITAAQAADAPATSPSSSPMHSPRKRLASMLIRTSSAPRFNWLNYRRVLCDDFAMDLDLVDTTDTDGVLKISASLTHFHAVVCAFDVFMLGLMSKIPMADSKIHPKSIVSTATTPASNAKKIILLNTVLEDASVTLVREIGEYFSPVARAYSYCTMSRVSIEAPASSDDTTTPLVVDLAVHFSNDSADELRDDEGMSFWSFNTVLGAWEPVIEPWTFELTMHLTNAPSASTSSTATEVSTAPVSGNPKLTIKLDLHGSENHALGFNFSPSLLESFCAIAKEMERLSLGAAIPVSTASVISCGFYLANDCGESISYWVSDQATPLPSHSRGFTYAPRKQRTPELLPPRHKVPLKLSTAVFPALPSDQTVSFSWGDDDWHPLTDVRIHSAGKYVYSILPKRREPSDSAKPRVLLALFDISSVFGYRTLTISSLVRVFNDSDTPIVCAILRDDGKTMHDFGTIEPQDACGVPITLIQSLASIRLLLKPTNVVDDLSVATSSTPLSPGTASQRHAAVTPTEPVGKEHRWSNELLINDKEDDKQHIASCSLVLDDYECRCQRMFDGSQPLHVSQICKANGSFFRVWNRVFTASNASSLRYAQVRVLPPLVFENKCNVSMYLVVFVFKKVRRTGAAQDREYFHLVASEKIPPHSSMQFLASSLQEQTYCSISMTGFSWSKLFLLPNRLSEATSTRPSSTSPADTKATTASTSSTGQRNNILCSLLDFHARKATLNVGLHAANEETGMQRVIIQPRFVIQNATKVKLTFEPSIKQKAKLPTPKTLFSLPTLSSASSKQAKTCCGSAQLEMIHTKLNALNGATTTSSSPTPRHHSSSTASNASIRVEEAKDAFFCSESAAIDIQIDGNATATSGVAHFRLDEAVGGANSTIRLFDETRKQWQDLGVILVQEDPFTTNVTFVDRYIFVNRTDHEFLCVPSTDIAPGMAQDPSSGMVLAPQSSSPFQWISAGSTSALDHCVRLKIQEGGGNGWRWSGKFSLHDVSETAFKLSNKYTNAVQVIRVEVRAEASVRMYVVVTSEDAAAFPLYRIINSSAHEMIHFKQSFENASGDLSEHGAASVDYNRGVTQRLLPGESICFGWDEAYFLQSLERVLSVSFASDAVHTKVKLDQPDEAQRVALPASKTKGPSEVFVHWYLHGMTKTIHIHDTKLPRDQLTGKQFVATATTIGKTTNALSELSVQLLLPNVQLSVLNNTPEELLLFTAEKLQLYYGNVVGENEQFETKIGSFQLDNQLGDAIFPVIFTPTPTTTSSQQPTIESPRHTRLGAAQEPAVKDDLVANPFFHLSVLRLTYGDNVEYIKYLSAMLQPAKVQIDDFLVMEIASFATDCVVAVQRYYPPPLSQQRHTSSMVENDVRSDSVISDGAAAYYSTDTTAEVNPDNVSTPTNNVPPPMERRMYVETLQLHPIKLQVTFQQNNLADLSSFDSQTTILLPVVFMILKSNLVNIDAASLNLNALHIYHSFTTPAFMLSAVRQHYTFQGILQLYAFVGAADILGNPIGLVTNLGTGVKDFFYEPVAGMVKSPQEFVFGLSRGTASLVKNSVYGTFNAASKFTGTLSSGIAALSMDSQYIKARNARNRQDVPTHLGTGLYYGTKRLGQGILEGVSGVITAPAMGAYHNGLTGFVEGVGKGLIGVAVKPTAGILDLAAKTTAGITATATVFDKKARSTRMRLPRMMHTSDKRLRVYSNEEALISQLLHRLPHRLAQNEHYEAHVLMHASSRVLLATSHQLLHIDYSVLPGMNVVVGAPTPPRITWKYPVASVWGAQRAAKGVNILIGSSSTVQLVSDAQTPVTKSSMTSVLVPLRDGPEGNALAERILKCVADLVARQRERTPVTETFSSPPPRNSIGLVLEPVRDDQASTIKGYQGFGGRVADVFVGSVAFRAGVQVDDIIIGFGKKPFEKGDHGSALRYQMSLMKKGDAIELMVLRHGEIKHMALVTE